MTENTPAVVNQPVLSPRDQRRLQKEAERERRRVEAEARRAQEEARLEAARRQAVRDAADRLLVASGKGAGLVAFRNLEATIKRVYPHAPAEYFETVLHAIGFDREAIASPRFGYLTAPGQASFEVFRDYVVHGEVAFDIEETTRGEVFSDGAVQVSQRVVYGSNGAARTVTEKHDFRTAHVQFTSTSWALSVQISPDDVPLARQLVAQVATHVDTLRPRQLSAGDIRDMVDAILNNGSQPPAEKLRQLSNLRYEHVLTDKEFLKAKERILGIGGNA